MVHRIQLWGRSWQQTDLNTQIFCQFSTVFCGTWCTSIFKQYQEPAAPMTPNHFQKILMRVFIPDVGNQEHYIATSDVEGTVQNALGTIAGYWHTSLLTDAAVTTIERRRLANDGLIKHE